ncbi:hypothetical protein [uncultured Fusobacterium sp.]|uniref:hypothetical protein n=1 Tax=uncultured Fusobacterium sp. TaxID=159267 RepID=UPI002606B755|nr:hypothetical protein [uncultured Fusobacterium sp.]
MIAYRGTEDKVKHNNKLIPEDFITDFKIYTKNKDIQQVEAVLFYEYIKTKYGAEKNIHITGHSLAGAIAQYVHFYAYCSNDKIFTVTWNGLGAYGSLLHTKDFFLYENYQTLFKKKIFSIDESEYLNAKNRLKAHYSTNLNILKKKREEVKNTPKIINYFMDEDFVGGYLNGDWIGQKILVNVKEKTLSDRAFLKTGVFSSKTGEEIHENRLSEKKRAAFNSHNINNFLVFMGDSGNITPCVIRKEFRKNALKTVVRRRTKSYSSLVENGSEFELRKKNTENICICRDILSQSRRLIGKKGFVKKSSITQDDILFVESFEDENRFIAKDLAIKKEPKADYREKIILGEYNNVESLGGIVGKATLEIKVYIDLVKHEDCMIESDEKEMTGGYEWKSYRAK